MYEARITRLHPTAFIILIDRSRSMQERIPFAGQTIPKAEAVAMVTNILLEEMINRCRRDDGVRDYFDIAVLGYGGPEAVSLLPAGGTFIKPSILAQAEPPVKTYTRERILPDGTSLITNIRQKVWIEAGAEGSTPMYDALLKAYDLAAKWCSAKAHRGSYPPTIFNITDGEASDGDAGNLLDIARRIKSLSTEDGNVLLVNINISAQDEATPVIFPSSEEIFGDSKYARLLYNMSSEMPSAYNEAIRQMKGGAENHPYRGMGYNTSPTDLIAMMNIGSVSVTMIQ